LNAAAAKRMLRALGDPGIARHSQRFFKTGKGQYGAGDRFLGIRVPELRRQARALEALPLGEVSKLLGSPFHEERLCALLILVRQFGRGTDADRAKIYSRYLALTRHVNNWDLVDSSAPHIVGGYLELRSRQPLYRLARSKSLWERRIAIMATLHFIRLGQFDDTLRLAERLLEDAEDLIHKAAGWMLREVGNRNRGVEERFLRAHYEEMPRTMLRYAIEKLPERRRKAYLTGAV
jgi:3-methyladenine DNA glycosylase AlkD